MGVTLLVDSDRKKHNPVTWELIAYFTERAFHKKISRQLFKEGGNLPNLYHLVSCAPFIASQINRLYSPSPTISHQIWLPASLPAMNCVLILQALQQLLCLTLKPDSFQQQMQKLPRHMNRKLS